MKPPVEAPPPIRHTGSFPRHRGVFSPTHQRIAKKAHEAALSPPKAAYVPSSPPAPYLGPECGALRSHKRQRLDGLHSASSMRRSVLAAGADVNLDVAGLAVNAGVGLDVDAGAGNVGVGLEVDVGVGLDSSSSAAASSSMSMSLFPSSSGSSSLSASSTSASPPASSSGPTSVSASTSASSSVTASVSTSASASASASTSASASASTSASASVSASGSTLLSASTSASGSTSTSLSTSALSASQSSIAQTSFLSTSVSPSRSSQIPSSSLQISLSTSISSIAPSTTAHSSFSASSDGGGHLATGTMASSTSGAPSSTNSGVLGQGNSNDSSFARNVDGIIGVSIGGVVALILGVVIVFFACRRFKPRRATGSPVPPTMRQSGGWRSPLEGDDESVAGASGGYTSTSLGHGNASPEGSGESGASDAHGTPAGPMPFAEAGATLRAIEPGAWYGGVEIPPATSSHGHSSQSHSNSGGAVTGSSGSHAVYSSSSPASSPPPPTSSDYVHTKSSSSGLLLDPRPMMPTPPSSYSLLEGEPKGRGAGAGLFGRFRAPRRGGTNPATNVPFTPATIRDPTSPHSGRRPSSLLNPPSPQQAWAAMHVQGWRPSAAQPMPSPALTDDGRAPEGLLRPGLATLLPATHSTRTLGDHVDYSRPIGGRVNVRMESAQTFETISSQDDVSLVS
ncbi:hypothetical protein DFH07DRAFT_1063430 [Mycena maculata]|uniref:Uncharacterized protein n=1 Tax=Mycena maculata TaxID=230809 RepID=A0AAD7N3M9_9AGAR|nr:hypothetical protein DFH07DRAFT_1063430 [Mycena maculata]